MADDRRQGSRRPRQGGHSDRHGFGSRRWSDSKDRREGSGWGERRARRDDGSRGSYSEGEGRTPADGEHRPYRDGGYRPKRDGERRPYRDGEHRSNAERPRRGWGTERGGAGSRDGRRDRDARRDSRPSQRQRVPEPPVDEDVVPQDLEPSARRELRALGRANAENVARHLVMVQRLLEEDPELAFQHARYAASHAGRVAVVRESAGIAAYLSGHYVEALRDIRAARRLSGLDLHRAIEADCERALGNLGRALKAAAEADPRQLDDTEEAEIAMVVSGVRHEMGETELGLVVIEEAIMMFRGDRETLRRLHSVRADRLEELGRVEEAQAVRERIGVGTEALMEDVAVYDIEDEPAEDEPAEGGPADVAPATTEADDETPGTEPATPDDEDEDENWSASFVERVEAEMAEILGETDALTDPDAVADPGGGTQDEED